MTANQHHVLIVDDEAPMRHMLRMVLERDGYTVSEASSGSQGLDRLRSGHFGLILCDIRMPEMDGLDATRAIRNGDQKVRNPKIPVVALTAHALQDYEEKSYAAGMDNYLTKPVDINQLSEVLQQVTLKN